MSGKTYLSLSFLPLLLFTAMKIYLRRYDGMTAGFAGLILLVPLLLSFLMGLLGLGFLWINDPKIPRSTTLLSATLIASSVALFYLLKSLF